MGWLDWIVPGTPEDKDALGVAKWYIRRKKAREAAEKDQRDAEERETEEAIREALKRDDDKEDA